MSRRWRIRFSLSALLCAMAVSSVLLGWLSVKLAESREQARAVSLLQKLGATVYYDFHCYCGLNGMSCLNATRNPTDWIFGRRLFGNDLFSTVYHVRFAEWREIPQRRPGPLHYLGPTDVPTAANEKAVEYIGLLHSLPDLHTLDLAGSTVNDSAIPMLAGLKTLKLIYLQNTSVSQNGLSELRRQLPECEIYLR